MSKKTDTDSLKRIADALERLAPATEPLTDLHSADAFIWTPDCLTPVKTVSHIDLDLLRGIDHVRAILERNTKQFAAGLPANNALLWGARGMGKSSLVKALHARICAHSTDNIHRPALIEIHREDIPSLPRLLGVLADCPGKERRIILFCDDLSFDDADNSYKSLKAVLEGGIEGRPANVIFYATSNRRHLMPRAMIENECSTAINPTESVDEKVSLSDRFGLWLGFHSCSQEDYQSMVEGYLNHFGIAGDRQNIHHQAREWSRTRGARSGRVAWQFIQDLAGRYKINI